MILRTLRFAATLIAMSGGAHWVLARWATRAFPRLATKRRWVIGVALALTVLPIAARVLTLTTKSGAAESLLGFAMVEFMLALLAAFPVLAAEVFARLATWRRPRPVPEAIAAALSEPAETSPPAQAPITRRVAIERIGGLAVLGTTGAALGWGMVRGRHAFEVEEVIVKIPGLPAALEGYTIAQVSDIHVGLFVGARELAEGLDRVRALKADMVVATGDLVDYDPRYSAQMARALADITARDGVFAILGNHDYYAGANDVLRALTDARVEVLVNAGRRIRAGDGGGFALLGVDDVWARQHGGAGPDLDRAIGMVPRDVPRILLAHQPNYFERSAGKVALQLSGHTHGGQINPIVRPADYVMPFVGGRYARGGSTLWVNRGFGVAGPPARIGAPPEVTKVVLVAG
jgi:predicted MPP superfamily phosphohydrolase